MENIAFVCFRDLRAYPKVNIKYSNVLVAIHKGLCLEKHHLVKIERATIRI